MSPPYKYDISPEKEASTLQYLWRQFFVTPPVVSRKDADLTGKTALVTGSNIGLGLEVARQLLDLNVKKLILAVRTISKGEEARTQLLAGRNLEPSAIEVVPLDLSNYDSIIEFATRAESLESLDIAVLNAGLYKVEESINPTTGFEEDIQVNFVSTALLTILLLPILKAKRSSNAPGRITLVSSDTAAWIKFKERQSNPILPAFKQPMAKWSHQERYGTSKLLGQLFVSELSDRIDAAQVTVNLANPGFCYGSGLAREGAGTFLGFLVNLYTRATGHSVPEGARSLTAGAAKFGQEVHGQYVEDGRIRPGAPLLYTSDGSKIAKKLWNELMDELAFVDARDKVAKVAKLS